MGRDTPLHQGHQEPGEVCTRPPSRHPVLPATPSFLCPPLLLPSPILPLPLPLLSSPYSLQPACTRPAPGLVLGSGERACRAGFPSPASAAPCPAPQLPAHSAVPTATRSLYFGASDRGEAQDEGQCKSQPTCWLATEHESPRERSGQKKCDHCRHRPGREQRVTESSPDAPRRGRMTRWQQRGCHS